MTTLQDVMDDTEDAMEDLCKEGVQVSPDQLGLDRRAGYRLYVVEGKYILARLGSGDRQLQYYGGFEYVDKEHRNEVGGYAVYSAECDRVRGAIEQMEESNQQWQISR